QFSTAQSRAVRLGGRSVALRNAVAQGDVAPCAVNWLARAAEPYSLASVFGVEQLPAGYASCRAALSAGRLCSGSSILSGGLPEDRLALRSDRRLHLLRADHRARAAIELCGAK